VHRNFIGHAAQMGRHPVGQRRADAVAHIDVIAVDGDPASRVDFHRRLRAVRSGAVILGDASHAGADDDPALLAARFLLGALLPDRMLLQLVQDLGRADGDDVRISVMFLPPVLSALRRRNSIGRAAMPPPPRRSAPPALSSVAACRNRASIPR
jgi:hypothetical protein